MNENCDTGAVTFSQFPPIFEKFLSEFVILSIFSPFLSLSAEFVIVCDWFCNFVCELEISSRTMTSFFYFAYGSNLLTRRIRINNSSAVRIANGILNDFKLDFADATADEKYHSPTWNGCPATIIPETKSKVVGVIWSIKNEDLEMLDRQEGVEVGIYRSMTVDVERQDSGELISCRTYQLVHNPVNSLDPQNRPFERCPSRDYLNVVVNGAVESKFNDEYVNFLKSFRHNGRDANNKELVASLKLNNFIV